MRQGVLNGDSLLRIKRLIWDGMRMWAAEQYYMRTHQRLCEEVDSEGVGVRIQFFEAALLLERHIADIFLGTARSDAVKLLDGGSAEDVEDFGQLVVAQPSIIVILGANRSLRDDAMK